MAERYKAMRERRGADFKERGGGRNQWRREGQSVDFGGKGSKWWSEPRTPLFNLVWRAFLKMLNRSSSILETSQRRGRALHVP